MAGFGKVCLYYILHIFVHKCRNKTKVELTQTRVSFFDNVVFAPFVQLKKKLLSIFQMCIHFEKIIMLLHIMVDGKNITLG
jgi:hypothetical protein